MAPKSQSAAARLAAGGAPPPGLQGPPVSRPRHFRGGRRRRPAAGSMRVDATVNAASTATTVQAARGGGTCLHPLPSEQHRRPQSLPYRPSTICEQTVLISHHPAGERNWSWHGPPVPIFIPVSCHAHSHSIIYIRLYCSSKLCALARSVIPLPPPPPPPPHHYLY